MRKSKKIFRFIIISFLLVHPFFGISQTIIYNSNEIYSGNYSLYGQNLPMGLTADIGSNKYISTYAIPNSGSINKNYIYKINNYWYLGREISGGGYFTPFSADWKCPIATTDNDPPCNCTWQSISNTVGSLGPSMKLFTGNCMVWPANMNGSTTLLPNGFVVPSAITSIIDAIQSPQTGTLIYDLTLNCLKIYNGTAWVCL